MIAPIMSNEVLGNPPIKTSAVESKVVVSDGDTVVIGGVMIVRRREIRKRLAFSSANPRSGMVIQNRGHKQHQKTIIDFCDT